MAPTRNLARAPFVAWLLAVTVFVTGFAAGARAAVVLNEVLYDPAGEDIGAEFVELWNSGDAAEPLAGFQVEAGDGARPGSWSTIFVAAGTDSIAPRGIYLVHGARLTGAIQNGPDGLRLTRAGVVLDRVGWGDLEHAEFMEGSSAIDAASGFSLARRGDGVDTDDNAADWEPSAPTPGAANHPPYRIVLASPRVRPEVAWPGDVVTLTVGAKHTGRRELAPGEWSVAVLARTHAAAAESANAGSAADDWLECARWTGNRIAPGESLDVALTWSASTQGAVDLRAIAWTRTDDESEAGRTGEVPRDSVSTSARVGPGPVVVNEIAFRDDGAGEWVELVAVEPVTDWGGVLLADATSAPRRLVVRGNAVTPPGSFRIVAADPTRFAARFAIPESLLLTTDGGWPSLNDAMSTSSAVAPFADVVRLVDRDGVPSDAVPYEAAWSARGGSLERVAVSFPSAAARTWSESVASAGATPGAPNSIGAFPNGRPATPALLAAAGRVLRRDGPDGRGALVLELGAEVTGRSVRLSILDLRGRVRRRLADGERFGAASAVVWDGHDDEGRAVEPGIYVASLEASSAGRESKRAAVTIAVAVRRGGGR